MNILCKYKSFRRTIEKNWKILQIIGFIFALVLANQVIQPFFKPQIEEIITTPLYGKSDYSGEPIKEVNYYIVSKIKYKINVPLFPLLPNFKKLNLKLPSKAKWKPSKKYLIIGYISTNPYIEFPTDFNKLRSDIEIEKLDKGIPIKITTRGFKIKQLTQTLYIKEKIDYPTKLAMLSTPKWYSDKLIEPSIDFEIDEPYLTTVGYAVPKEENFNWVYQIFKVKIKNDGELDIKGYFPKFSYKMTECDEEGREYYKFESKNSWHHISFDLKSGETKEILLYKQVPQEDKYGFVGNTPYFKFYYTDDRPICQKIVEGIKSI